MACYVLIEKVEEKQQLQSNYQEKKKTKINKTKYANHCFFSLHVIVIPVFLYKQNTDNYDMDFLRFYR